MKCEKCPCCMATRYPESNDVDYDCIAGMDENIEEFKDGHLGCRIHYKTAYKIANEY